MNYRIYCSLKLVALVTIFADIIQANEITTEFEGGIRISCTDGTCTFNEECTNLDSVPGVLSTHTNATVYSDIFGDIALEPSSCRAECSGCGAIPGSDNQDADGCIGSAGYVYCPENNSCIRPWENNCPFEGASFIGPVDIICSNGSRCNELSAECEISIGSFEISGLYLDGLLGTYSLPDGCTGICEGCYCENCPAEGNNAGGQGDPPGSAATRNVLPYFQSTFLGFAMMVILSLSSS